MIEDTQVLATDLEYSQPFFPVLRAVFSFTLACGSFLSPLSLASLLPGDPALLLAFREVGRSVSCTEGPRSALSGPE